MEPSAALGRRCWCLCQRGGRGARKKGGRGGGTRLLPDSCTYTGQSLVMHRECGERGYSSPCRVGYIEDRGTRACARLRPAPRTRLGEGGGGEGDPVTPVPVNTRAGAWFTHIGNLGNAGTAFRCRDGYIEPVNAGQGPVASGSANAFSARGGMTANGELGAGRVVQLRAPHECGAARTGRRASQR